MENIINNIINIIKSYLNQNRLCLCTISLGNKKNNDSKLGNVSYFWTSGMEEAKRQLEQTQRYAENERKQKIKEMKKNEKLQQSYVKQTKKENLYKCINTISNKTKIEQKVLYHIVSKKYSLMTGLIYMTDYSIKKSRLELIKEDYKLNLLQICNKIGLTKNNLRLLDQILEQTINNEMILDKALTM